MPVTTSTSEWTITIPNIKFRDGTGTMVDPTDLDAFIAIIERPSTVPADNSPDWQAATWDGGDTISGFTLSLEGGPVDSDVYDIWARIDGTVDKPRWRSNVLSVE